MCHWVQFPSPWKGTQELVQTERKNSGKHKATAKSEDKSTTCVIGTSNELVKTGRRCYELINRNLKYFVHHTVVFQYVASNVRHVEHVMGLLLNPGSVTYTECEAPWTKMATTAFCSVVQDPLVCVQLVLLQKDNDLKIQAMIVLI